MILGKKDSFQIFPERKFGTDRLFTKTLFFGVIFQRCVNVLERLTKKVSFLFSEYLQYFQADFLYQSLNLNAYY